ALGPRTKQACSARLLRAQQLGKRQGPQARLAQADHRIASVQHGKHSPAASRKLEAAGYLTAGRAAIEAAGRMWRSKQFAPRVRTSLHPFAKRRSNGNNKGAACCRPFVSPAPILNQPTPRISKNAWIN